MSCHVVGQTNLETALYAYIFEYFVYAPQMSIASLPGGFYTVYILNNAGAQTFVGTIVK